MLCKILVYRASKCYFQLGRNIDFANPKFYYLTDHAFRNTGRTMQDQRDIDLLTDLPKAAEVQFRFALIQTMRGANRNGQRVNACGFNKVPGHNGIGEKTVAFVYHQIVFLPAKTAEFCFDTGIKGMTQPYSFTHVLDVFCQREM
ncbi:hypothetical protein SRABI106_03373 [Rahnella aquatilis]|nr:hypothetical protein SRABI106_03373 [Rahnella aquatilis]